MWPSPWRPLWRPPPGGTPLERGGLETATVQTPPKYTPQERVDSSTSHNAFHLTQLGQQVCALGCGLSRGSPEVHKTLVSLGPGPGAGLEHETCTGTFTKERKVPELRGGGEWFLQELVWVCFMSSESRPGGSSHDWGCGTGLKSGVGGACRG